MRASLTILALTLAACTGALPAEAGIKALHHFGVTAGDGQIPGGPLVNIDGTFYGVTAGGGANNTGTVYSISPSGVESVIYSFGAAGSGDGYDPVGGLIDVDGTLYGVTDAGGAGFVGTVFSVTTSGAETTLYSFPNDEGDGSPNGPLLYSGGLLYGTASASGSFNRGSVFSLSLDGSTANVVYSFGGYSGDGTLPVEGLVDEDGTLYGTTEHGGSNGYGTVYSLTPDGTETVLYSFGSVAQDGQYPTVGLTDVAGTLYGTTSVGGSGGTEYGTVFSITTGGSYQSLYSFGSDYWRPTGILTNVNGTLYGVTGAGGTGTNFKCTSDDGCGVVYSVTTAGTATLVGSMDFRNGAYGGAGLTSYNNLLYGTTFNGGKAIRRVCQPGCGTVFSLRLR
jgi:uncharacterized repeat protein (TIGR03803 family)